MTLCDENQETMNADKVRQVMEAVAAIKEQWPKPEDDSRGKISVKRIECDLNAGYNPNDPSFGMTVEGVNYSTSECRKRKFSMFIGEGDVANLHRMSGEYLETKRARRAERVVATCHGFSEADGACNRRLLEGDPRKGWLRCEKCGESFCCKRCAVDHLGVDEICTGRCVVSIA